MDPNQSINSTIGPGNLPPPTGLPNIPGLNGVQQPRQQQQQFSPQSVPQQQQMYSAIPQQQQFQQQVPTMAQVQMYSNQQSQQFQQQQVPPQQFQQQQQAQPQQMSPDMQQQQPLGQQPLGQQPLGQQPNQDGVIDTGNPEYGWQPQPAEMNNAATEQGRESAGFLKSFLYAPSYLVPNFFIVISRDITVKEVYKLGLIHSVLGLVLALLKGRPEVSFCMVLGYIVFLVLYYYIVPNSEHTDALKSTLKGLKVLRATNVMTWLQMKLPFVFNQTEENDYDSEDDDEEAPQETQVGQQQQWQPQPQATQQPQQVPQMPPQPSAVSVPQFTPNSMQAPQNTDTSFEEDEDSGL